MAVSEQLRVALADRYRIVREIGAGGMATVYLAEDLKHRRNVALKVLRPELAAVLGTERFLSEINVTANLQHPHLLPLFDSGDADGLLFYVMPYIEGESLRHRLERERQLPVDEAVRIAAAVASALAYAHRHDVIHRDLKPENILLHEGQPVVTDFGIALAISNAGGGRITQTGLSLGTPQYMSPEQATGDRIIDARSDVYSLGAVTYEMLVGDPPHVAGTTQGIIAKVLTERAPSVRAYRDSVPEHIDAAVQCALAKLPADRFASAGDFAEALLGTRAVVLVRPTSRVVPERDVVVVHEVPPHRRRLATLLPWALAGSALLALGALMWPVREPAPWPVLFELTFADSIEPTAPAGVTMALSRDGAHLAFTAQHRNVEGIFLRRLDGEGATFIRGTEDGSSPVISPDGRELAFVADGLKKVPLSGGAPITLADSATTGVTWSDRGDLLFAWGGSIRMVPAEGGPSVVIATRDSARDHRRYGWLHALPGGRAALLTVWRGGVGLPAAQLAVVTIPDGVITELGVVGTGPRYLSRERVVIFGREDGSILAAPFSLRQLRFTGPAVPVLAGVAVKGGGAVDLAASDNGTVIYRTVANVPGQLAVVSREGVEKRTIALQSFQHPRVSADGRRIVAGIYEVGQRDIWVHDLSTGTTSRVTANGASSSPEWLDADRIVYIRAGEGAPRLEVQRVDGTGSAVQFGGGAGGLIEIAVGPPGGYHVIRHSPSPAAASDLRIMPVDSPGTTRPLLETAEDERMLSLSPDGRRLAFVSDRNGRREVYVRRVPGPDQRIQISTNGGQQPVWTPDGRELIYRSGGWLRSVTISADPVLDIVRRDSLFADVYGEGSGNTRNYDIFPNGDLALPRSRGAESRLMGIANWKATTRN